jgi:hypothetical protein
MGDKKCTQNYDGEISWKLVTWNTGVGIPLRWIFGDGK